MRATFVAIILAAAAEVVSAASPYTRILLPLFLSQPAPGAYGSVWQSQFVIHNGSVARSYIIDTCASEVCLTDLRSDEELVPNETQIGLPARYPVPANPAAGAILWLSAEGAPPDDAQAVAFQLRVVDVSRSATAVGTEMPVIRENEFRTSTIHLLNVPTDARFRTALRIFEMNLDRADFTIRVFDQSTNALHSVRLVRTTSVAPHRFDPAFVELSDLPASYGTASEVRIEIEPRTAGIAFWSYVSLTNNDSQQITLVTPQ